MNKRFRPVGIVLGIVFLLLAGWIGMRTRNTQQTEIPEHSVTESVLVEPTYSVSKDVEWSEEQPFVSPIDFEKLIRQNPDTRAWLSIPGLEQEGPVVCRDGDDSYYLRRDFEGNYSVAGTYFIESYNRPDFSDPVTVIYGHNMNDGTMFGTLQETYSNAKFFDADDLFTVHTPDGSYDYQIFAAVPYGSRHILYYHNFHSFSILETFLEEIYSTRSLIANVNRDVEISEGDRIVILSTCQDGDKTQRYLVMGVSKFGGLSAEIF